VSIDAATFGRYFNQTFLDKTANDSLRRTLFDSGFRCYCPDRGPANPVITGVISQGEQHQ
jgi:hypothetical protein